MPNLGPFPLAEGAMKLTLVERAGIVHGPAERTARLGVSKDAG
jgi:hypothetical protein